MQQVGSPFAVDASVSMPLSRLLAGSSQNSPDLGALTNYGENLAMVSGVGTGFVDRQRHSGLANQQGVLRTCLSSSDGARTRRLPAAKSLDRHAVEAHRLLPRFLGFGE